MYIDDVVNAYMSVQDRGISGEAYNVGGSGFQNIFDTVKIIIEEMGVDIEPQILEKDFIEIKEQYLDQSKLEGLGWKCKYDIRRGIRASIPWYVEYHKNPRKFYWAH
jgi:dTDP-glucose 4,6-dehydratase